MNPVQKCSVDLLLQCLSIEGITGQEKAIGDFVIRKLIEAGVPKSRIQRDHANKLIPLPTETGNVIAHLPGTIKGPTYLFSTHLDTVPLCAGAAPIISGEKITSKTATALGGDNRTGVAVLIHLAKTLLSQKIPHPPITLLFTVREESGLFGARNVNPDDLRNPIMGFNVDGRTPRDITIGAVGAERFEIEIHGKASHAGVHPERGISSTMVASLALSQIHQEGWFGKIRLPQGEGTSNIGVFSGKNMASAGDATNVVTDYVFLKGEARSHDPKFPSIIRKQYQKAFANAAAKVRDDKGHKAKIIFHHSQDYFPFRIKENAPVVYKALTAGRNMGFEPQLKISNGGLDANWLCKLGIPTITFGAGQNNIHTVDEYVHIPDYLEGCEFALSLVNAISVG